MSKMKELAMELCEAVRAKVAWAAHYVDDRILGIIGGDCLTAQEAIQAVWESNPQNRPAAYWQDAARELYNPETGLFGEFKTGGECADYLCSTAVREYLVGVRKADLKWRHSVKKDAPNQPV